MAQTDFGIRLSNDHERAHFLDDYTNENCGWYLWQRAPIVQRRWWRRDFDDWSIVVEDAVHRRLSPMEDGDVATRTVIRVYLVENWNLPLENATSYKTRILAHLKTATMGGKTV